MTERRETDDTARDQVEDERVTATAERISLARLRERARAEAARTNGSELDPWGLWS